MNLLLGYLSCAAVAVAVLIFGQAEAASLIRTQGPCVNPSGGYCVRFTYGTAADLTVRSFSFNAPSAGMVEATFHGSMTCLSQVNAEAVARIDTQIVDNANTTADSDAAGGLRYDVLLLPGNSSSFDAFNLASTRVFQVPRAGKQTYYFRVHRILMDDLVSCTVHNGAFSIVFVP